MHQNTPKSAKSAPKSSKNTENREKSTKKIGNRKTKNKGNVFKWEVLQDYLSATLGMPKRGSKTIAENQQKNNKKGKTKLF